MPNQVQFCNLKAVATDTAGNTSNASTPFEFAISENDGLWQGSGYGTYDEVWKTVDLDKLKPPGDDKDEPPSPPPNSGNPSNPANPDPSASIPGLRPPTPEDESVAESQFFGALHGGWDLYGMNNFGDPQGPSYRYGRLAAWTANWTRYIWTGFDRGLQIIMSEYMPFYYNAYYGRQEPSLDPNGNPYYGPPNDPNAPPLSPPRPKPDFMEKVQIILDELRPKL